MRLFSALVVVLCLAAPATAKPDKVRRKARPVQDSYLVLLNDGVRGNVRNVAHDLTRNHGGKIKLIWEDAVRGFSMIADANAAAAIADDPRVIEVAEDEYAELDQFCVRACAPLSEVRSRCNDAHVPWQIDRIDQPSLPLTGYYENCAATATNAVAYIIDSGVSPHGEFLDKNGNTRLKDGWAVSGGPTTDPIGHGTAVASFAAGLDSGVAKNADIIPVRVMKSDGNTTVETTTAGVNWVVQHHTDTAAVANISINFGSDTTLDTAVNNLVADGVIVVVSAGNSNRDGCGGSPARASSAIVVGATTKTDARWSSSNYGPCVTLFAPGEKVGGAAYGQFTQLDCSPGLTGTSFAAPLTAGVALIAYAKYDGDGYTPAMIRNLLINHSEKNELSGIPTGTPNRLLQSNVVECDYTVCAIACTDPRCANSSSCPPPDH